MKSSTNFVGTPESSALLQRADAHRQRAEWPAAADLYRAAEALLPRSAVVKHNIAICLLAVGEAQAALECALAALALEPGLWQSDLLCCKALRQLDRGDEALSRLTALFVRQPGQAEVRLVLASTMLHEWGDAAGASRLAASLLSDPAHQRDAALTTLMAALYDREMSAEALAASLAGFAVRYLDGANAPATVPVVVPESVTAAPLRPRLGLISPMFCCSPVYFFCIGALRLLARDVDLVFIDRSARSDWATDAFKAIARDWIPAVHQDAQSLATLIRQLKLDALIDLGGWSDPVGLRALACKPAPLMYKWVGGQSASTGLKAFDGMLTDAYQTPPEFRRLYSEPLVMLAAGYVTYTPPDYLPAPAAPARGDNVFGVISNPAKVSRAFLLDLKLRLGREAAPFSLRFIDKRYRHDRLQKRVIAALRSGPDALPESVTLEFVVPTDHPDYLRQVGRLSAVLDTFPYTGGLTTVEALSLGVPSWTRAGMLFCERHTYAHCRYAGLPPSQFDLERFDPASAARQAASLIPADSPRLNHAALATELLPLVAGRIGHRSRSR